MLLRNKILIFFTILLLLIFFEWFYFNRFRSQVFKEEMLERGSILVRTFAQLSREPLLSLQITRLEQQLDSLLQEKDVLNAQVYTTDYKILAATDRGMEGWSYSGEMTSNVELFFNGDTMIARAPIIILDEIWGMAEITFSLKNMNQKINHSKEIFILIFITEIILAVSFAAFLQIQLVRPLSKLAYEVKKITPLSLEFPFTQLKFTAPEILRVKYAIDDMRKKLNQAQEEVVSKTQFAIMGQIAANITHEIRNPLEAISGAVEIISSEENFGKNSKESLSIIQDEIQNLNDYLNKFLELTRSEPICSEKVQLNHLINDCIFLLNPLFMKKKIKIKIKLEEELPLCTVDVNQIKRVIVNLFLNSIEAINKNGILWISSSEEKKFIVIIIRDNGQGIRKEDLSYVFDPYFTTKRRGSGIGLALSKKTIEQHKGSIYINSCFGRGTTVTIKLPL